MLPPSSGWPLCLRRTPLRATKPVATQLRRAARTHLLNYIEQVEKLKTKPAFTVPTEFFVAHQHELKGLPELQFNLQVDGDDVWLRVPRLKEIVPPELDEPLKPWVTLPKNPEKAPELKSVVPY